MTIMMSLYAYCFMKHIKCRNFKAMFMKEKIK